MRTSLLKMADRAATKLVPAKAEAEAGGCYCGGCSPDGGLVLFYICYDTSSKTWGCVQSVCEDGV